MRRRTAIFGILLLGISYPVLCGRRALADHPAEQPKVPVVAQQRQLPPEERGDVLLAQRQYMAAIKAYRQAPADSATVWNKMGIAWQHLFATDQAKLDYERALRIKPNYPEAINNLGTIYYAQRNYKQAIKLYRRALKSMPRSATVYNNLGAAYFAQGKFDRGAAAYRSAFSIDPAVFSTASYQGIAALGSAEQQAEQNYCLAELFARAGMMDRAVEYLRKAMDEGFSDRKRLKQDRNFAALRKTAAYAQLMQEMKKR